MEAYGLFRVGFMLDLEVVLFEQNPACSAAAVQCKIKPRTNDADASTRLPVPYYN